jgi:anaerobic sulfite reductase subunit B
MITNEYLPFSSKVLKVTKHTPMEYTYTMEFAGAKDVVPGQFFELSLPKYGEAPISVSGIGENSVDLTVRSIGVVTDELFKYEAGRHLYIRGPYGNGFIADDYKDSELLVIAGGTGVSPVKAIIDYFGNHNDEVKSMSIITGFKSKDDQLFRDDFDRWENQMNVTLTFDKGDESKENIGLVTKYIPSVKVNNFDDAKAIVVGPPIMMKFAVKGLIERGYKEENIWISHERRMSCGLGKCGHCRVNSTYICLDGPVFNYTVGKDLID